MNLNEDLKKILQAVKEGPGSVKSVSTLTNLEPSDVNDYMDYLKSEGYITGGKRRPDDHNGAAEYSYSKLTGKGKVAINESNSDATNTPTSKYDFRGAQFAGGYVGGDVKGNQYGGTINNYGSSAADITRLITALREHAQAFPDEQKDDALDTLDDLEGDLAKAEPDPGRIGRRLKRLAAIATALTIGTTGFAADLAQLAETLNVPLPKIQVEQVQPEQLPPSN